MNIFDAHISGALSVSGSGEISNDLLISGNLTVLGWISGSVSGNITNADTASYAPKYTLTTSFNDFTSSYNTGSFSGSFKGDGSGLYNIPASGVTGLNLNQISDGSATASISQANGLRINTNTEITGTLKVTGGIYSNGIGLVSGSDQFTGSYDQRYVLSGSITQTTWDNIANKPAGIVSGSIQVELTGTTGYSTFSSSISSSIDSLSSSVAITNLSQNNRLDSLETESGSIRTTFNSFTSSALTRVSAIETSTSSLNSFTSSASGRLTSLESASSSIRTDFNSYTSSNDSTNNTQNGRLNSLESTSASLNSYTSSNTTNINAIHTATSSLNTFSSSILGAVEVTGSNLTVKGNLLVKGTTTQVDSTTITVGDNIIQLNGSGATNAGLVVQDATGASIISGSLLWDTSTDYWKAGKLGSEERIILVNEYSTFSTSIDSRATSLETSRTALNSYTSSTNTRLGSIETSTSSLNSFTSSASGRLTSLESASSSIRTDFNSYTSSNDSRLSAIETSTGSLNTFTSSQNTFNTAINTATASLNTTTSSLNTFTSSTNTRLGVIESTTASLNSYTSSTNTRLAVIESTTASLNTFTSSAAFRLTEIETSTSSLNSFTSSINTTIKNKMNTDGVISGSVQVDVTQTTNYSTFSSSIASINLGQDNRLNSLEGKTGSYATTGSNIFQGSQTISGSLVITQNLQVFGSSSITYVTASQLAISTSFISVNVFEPAERFGGIKVYDSGSSNATASLAWDSLNNRWIYQNASGSSYSGGMLIAGPRNTGSLGDETALTSGKIVKSIGGDHIDNSIMNETSGVIYITGSLSATGTVYGTNITSIESTTSSLNSYTSSNTTNINAIHTATSSLNSYTSSNITNINAIHTATSSLNTFTSSAGSRLTSIETSTSSLNTFTSSAGSRLTSLETTTGSLNTAVSALNTFSSSALTRLTAIETSTSSLNSYTSSNTTNINAIHTATSSLNSYTSSNNTNISAIHTATSSLNSYTSSQNTHNTAVNTATSSLNTFTSSFNSAFSLSGADVTVKGNFTVSGTTTTINSTTVAIGDNIIQLNGTGATNAGLVVRDATASTLTSGSLLWDTTNDKWIAGPLGSEDDIVLRTATQTLTNKTISGASNTLSNIGNSSLTNSSITIGSTAISLGATGTTIAGLTSLSATALTGSLQGNASTATSASYASTATSSSYATNAGTATTAGSATTATSASYASTATSSSYATNAGTATTAGSATSATSAGSVTNAVTFNTSGGAAAGTTYNGSAARTIDYSTVGAAPAAGNSSITTVGTISSGTWNGSVIGVSYGGTGLSSVTANRIPYGNGTSALQTSANLTFDGSTLALTGTLTATVKSFTIDHPTKEGMKLQYGNLEGPEHGVYVRGKLIGENKIILPDYWYALIHEDTITVNLTPIGKQQVLYVKSINSTEIIVDGDENINCHYTVFAERKDVNKLIIEHS